MKSFLGLILVVGMVVAGWMNRERIGNLWGQAGAVAEQTLSTSDSSGVASPRAAATPHPAREAQARAMALYPGLSISGSPLNQKFIALYKEAQAANHGLLARPDWPIQLAERAVISLGGAPMPQSTRVAQVAPAQARKAVVVYTTSHCPYCKQAKQYLAQKGVPYREVDIERSRSGEAEYRKLGGDGVPLIVVGDKKLQGFSAKALDNLLL